MTLKERAAQARIQREAAGGTLKERAAQAKADKLASEMVTSQDVLDANREKATPKSGMDAFTTGLGYSAASTAIGIADLFGIAPEDAQIIMAEWKKDLDDSEGMAGTAGQVTGEILQLALPASKIAKLKSLKILDKGGKLTSYARKALASNVTKEAALGAAYGGAKLPVGDESRLKNAAIESAANIAGLGMGKVLSKAVSGATKTPAAKELLKEGVDLDVGSMAGGVTEGLDEFLSYLPLTARHIKGKREAAKKSWVNYALNKANPEGMPNIEGIGTEAMTALGKNVKKGYDAAWNMVEEAPVKEKLAFLQRELKEFGKYLSVDEAKVLKKLQKDITKQMKEPTEEGYKILDNAFRKEIKTATGNANKRDLLEVLTDTKETLRTMLPEQAQATLKNADSGYRKYLVVKDADLKASGAETAGLFTPAQLNTAVKKFDKSANVGKGKADIYKEMREGVETVGKQKLGGVTNKFIRIMQVAPSLPTVPTMADALLNATVGDNILQKAPQMIRDINIPLGKNMASGVPQSTTMGNVLRRGSDKLPAALVDTLDYRRPYEQEY